MSLGQGFWPNFPPNTIRYGRWRNFHAKTIHYGLWPNFQANTIYYRFWPNFPILTISPPYSPPPYETYAFYRYSEFKGIFFGWGGGEWVWDFPFEMNRFFIVTSSGKTF